MKRILKWVLIVIGALFLMGVIGSFLSPDGRRGLSEGVADAVRTATVGPTVAPTPDPTVAPTPEPTPDPTPEPTVDTGAIEAALFADHVIGAAETLTRDLDAMNDAANGADIDAVTDAAIDLWIDAGAEREWLEANPPSDCYAGVYNEWLDAVTEYEQAGDLISDGWIYSDMDLVDEGIDAMNRGTDALSRTSAEVEDLDC